jgi:hypothetical protein
MSETTGHTDQVSFLCIIDGLYVAGNNPELRRASPVQHTYIHIAVHALAA